MIIVDFLICIGAVKIATYVYYQNIWVTTRALDCMNDEIRMHNDVYITKFNTEQACACNDMTYRKHLRLCSIQTIDEIAIVTTKIFARYFKKRNNKTVGNKHLPSN